MTKYLQKCKECGKYGIANPESKCKECGGQLINSQPPKFSTTDKYGDYRLIYFKEEFKKRFDKN